MIVKKKKGRFKKTVSSSLREATSAKASIQDKKEAGGNRVLSILFKHGCLHVWSSHDSNSAVEVEMQIHQIRVN